MDVTKQNFKEVLPLVSKAIQDATFLAVDTEFTGLSSENNLNAFDTPDERYNKLKETVHQFLLIQFGLCAFQYNSGTQKFTNKAFNFYIFPRPFSKHAPDPKFLCQASSLHFLVTHGFDFTKLIKEGISYLDPENTLRLKEMLLQKHTLEDQAFQSSSEEDGEIKAKNKPVVIPDEQKAFIQKIHEEIENMVKTEKDELNLEPCNSFLRRLIYESVQEKFKGIVILHTAVDEEGQRYIVVSRGTEQEMKEKMKLKQASEMEELEDAVGFTKVIKMISDSRKLVIGHNMILDLLHICNNFVAPIPKSYEDFKLLLKTTFPSLLDTKLMATSSPFKERFFMKTGLGTLLKEFGDNPCETLRIEPADEYEGYRTTTAKEHEAGYDAFITGVCFIALCDELGRLQKPNQKVLPESPLLQPYKNKLFLRKSNDIPYLNIQGKDIVPNRDHVFHVSFPSDWKASDLAQLFYPVAGPVYISWINETSAYVSLKKPEKKQIVHRKLVGKRNGTYTVMPYKEYRQHTHSANKAKPAFEKKRPSYPQSDVKLPQKRKRSSGSGGSTDGNHAIDTIPEEEEETMSTEPEEGEIQEPKESNSAKSSKSHKIFEEMDTWT